jgi:hypothetical protein
VAEAILSRGPDYATLLTKLSNGFPWQNKKFA